MVKTIWMVHIYFELPEGQGTCAPTIQSVPKYVLLSGWQFKPMVSHYLKYLWLLLSIKGEILIDAMNENDVLIA